MHELQNMLEVETPMGWGHAILVESANHDTLWTVVLADTLAIVTFKQNQLKVCRNYSNGWNFPDAELLKVLKAWKAQK